MSGVRMCGICSSSTEMPMDTALHSANVGYIILGCRVAARIGYALRQTALAYQASMVCQNWMLEIGVIYSQAG
jgi:hypothetical protein